MAKEILGKTDAQKALVVQKRLMDDYLPFFENIQGYYADTAPDSKEAKLCNKMVTHIKRANKLISRVFLGVGLTASTKAELKQLNQVLEEIEVGKDYLTQRLPNDTALSQFLNMAEEKTGIKREDLDMSVALTSKAKKDKTDASGAGLGGIFGGYIGKGLGAVGLGPKRIIAGAGIGQILAPLLGPYWAMLPAAYMTAHVLGKAGFAAGRGIGGLGRRGRAAFNRRRKTAGGEKFFESLAQRAPASVPVPDAMPGAFASPVMPKPGRDLKGRFAPEGLSGEIALGMRKFFDHGAYRARWTKAALRALTGKKEKPAAKRFAGFGAEKATLDASLISKRKVGIVAGLVTAVLAALGLGIYKMYKDIVAMKENLAEVKTQRTKVEKEATVQHRRTLKEISASDLGWWSKAKEKQVADKKLADVVISGKIEARKDLPWHLRGWDEWKWFKEKKEKKGAWEALTTPGASFPFDIKKDYSDPYINRLGRKLIEPGDSSNKATETMRDTKEWSLWPALTNWLKRGKTSKERGTRAKGLGISQNEILANEEAEAVFPAPDPTQPPIVVQFPQLNELKDRGKYDKEILETLKHINENVKAGKEPALGHVPVGGSYGSADPMVSNINENGID